MIKNKALFGTHLFLALIYLSLWNLFRTSFVGPVADILMGFILLHVAAAYGAATSSKWGRTLSKVVGTIMLIGVPVGTAFGAFILSRSGRRWTEAQTEAPADVAEPANPPGN